VGVVARSLAARFADHHTYSMCGMPFGAYRRLPREERSVQELLSGAHDEACVAVGTSSFMSASTDIAMTSMLG
jgi:hypothetical protein